MALTDHIRKDSPTNNFATLNSLSEGLTGTLTEGNLKYTTGNVHCSTRGNFYVSSGKWYWEVYIVNITAGIHVGISSIDEVVSTSGNIGDWKKNNAIDYYSVNGYLFYNNTNSGSWGNTFTADNIIGVYLNLDTNQLSFYKNNTLQASAIDLTSSTYNLGTLTFTSRFDDGSNSNGGDVFVINHGQDSSFAANKTDSAGPYTDANGIGKFYYQPPTGALALCTQNIPTPIMNPDVGNKPEDFFKCVDYVGNATSGTTSGKNILVGFAPDLVWVKDRDGTYYHQLHDSVRGTSGGVLYSNGTDAQDSTYGLNNFTGASNDGFSLGANSSAINTEGNKIIAWCWKAGGAPASDGVAMVDETATTTAALKTAASATITPTRMSVNTKAGFSIVKYTSPNNSSDQTVPHGLATTPDWIITKNLNSAFNWDIYHSSVSNSGIFTTAAINSRSAYGTVNNNVFTTKNTFTHNSTNNYIAYCWHSVPGYSAFGSYAGNSSTDGPFVYTGFRPAWVMIKNSSDGNSWMILDNQRSLHNLSHQAIRAESNGNEITNQESNYGIDLLSNGFKPRTSGGASTNSNNATGDTYIYMAFAEQNFKYTTAR